MWVIPLCLVGLVLSDPLPPVVRGRPKGGFLGSRHLEDLDYPETEDEYMIYSNITQPVDHFDVVNKQTWSQQYQYNSKFYNANESLVFLMIGGEGPIGRKYGGDKWVRNENVSMMVWAQEFGAAAFQVEHRFYGDSRPFPEQTTEALRYLTIEQVLADLKEFITQMNKLYFPNDNPKWITFGGSYPGSLSAWFRATYPEMTIAAVSTSSAVNVRVDYYGYAVNADANYHNISQECGRKIGNGMLQVANVAYKSDGLREAITDAYYLCSNFTGHNFAKEIQYYFSNMYSLFQDVNQYNMDNRGPINNVLTMENGCDRVTMGTGDDSAAIVRFNDWYRGVHQITDCLGNSYQDFVAQLSKTDYADMDLASTRTWVWQTCTYLGYFQTTDGGNHGIFQSTIPLDFYVDQCIDIFGKEYTADYIFDAVAKTQKNYGGDKNYNGTKVVFPNGSFDPWKSLGKLTPNPANDVDAFLIDGTAHCADMYPARDEDYPSLIAGRQRIHDNLARWIKDAFSQASPTPSIDLTTPTTASVDTSTKTSATCTKSILATAALIVMHLM